MSIMNNFPAGSSSKSPFQGVVPPDDLFNSANGVMVLLRNGVCICVAPYPNSHSDNTWVRAGGGDISSFTLEYDGSGVVINLPDYPSNPVYLNGVTGEITDLSNGNATDLPEIYSLEVYQYLT